MLSLFLGAGFSKWAMNLPLASELFDFQIDPWGREEIRKLEPAQRIKIAWWDQAHPNGLAEQFIADALALGGKPRDVILWYIVRKLSDPFIWREYHAGRRRRHVLMIDEKRKYQISGMEKTTRFLQGFGNDLAGIATTNYDMVVEYALGTKGFHYGSPGEVLKGRGAYPLSEWTNPITLKGRMPLAKIHGSISWDEQNHYTDGRRGLTGNALIVAPTPEKQPPSELIPEWELAADIIAGSHALLVLGFAFNPYDEAVLNLLQSAGGNLRKVLLVDPAPQIDRARRLWPHAVVEACSPPPDGTSEIDDWLKQGNR